MVVVVGQVVVVVVQRAFPSVVPSPVDSFAVAAVAVPVGSSLVDLPEDLPH